MLVSILHTANPCWVIGSACNSMLLCMHEHWKEDYSPRDFCICYIVPAVVRDYMQNPQAHDSGSKSGCTTLLDQCPAMSEAAIPAQMHVIADICASTAAHAHAATCPPASISHAQSGPQPLTRACRAASSGLLQLPAAQQYDVNWLHTPSAMLICRHEAYLRMAPQLFSLHAESTRHPYSCPSEENLASCLLIQQHSPSFSCMLQCCN